MTPAAHDLMHIPKVGCIPGCHDCCGRVPFTDAERARVEADRPDIEWLPRRTGRWLPHDGKQVRHCAFLGPDGCTIYEKRPMICRLYGAAEGHECMHECGPLKKLSRERARQLMAVGSEA